MTDYRSPAATHSSYAKDDPTATSATSTTSGTTNLAYAGHPANSVTVSDPNAANTQHGTHSTTTTTTTGSHEHHHGHHGHHHNHSAASTTTGTHPNTTTTHNAHDNNNNPNNNTVTGRTGGGLTGPDATSSQRIVKTGEYVTGLEPNAAALGPNPVPVVGNSHQERITGAPATAGPAVGLDAAPLHDTTVAGRPAAAGLGGSLGGAVVLGGACECLRNGGTCQHGAGQCKCRGCSTGSTVVNPGMNIGIADVQNHTAAQANTNNNVNNTAAHK